MKKCGSWAKEKVSTCGRKWTLTDSEKKMNRSEVSSKWNKCRIYVGDQLERTQGSAKLALKWQFMMMPMIIFGR
jgi:hypothetical protein